MEYKNTLNLYTANSKKRACTRKAETKDKVNAMNERMAEHCDKMLAKDADNKERSKAERHNRRESFKQKRLENKSKVL